MHLFQMPGHRTVALALAARVLGPGHALHLAHAHDAQLFGQLRHLLSRRPHLQEGAAQDLWHRVSITILQHGQMNRHGPK